MKQSTFNIKIYNKESVLQKNLSNEVVITSLRFNQKINGGQGELSLDFNFPFDEIPSYLSLFNFVRVWAIDEFNPKGKLIYSGWISQVTPVSTLGTESIRVTFLGLSSLLGSGKYKDGASFDVEQSGVDPSAVIADILSKFQSDYPPSASDEWIGTDNVLTDSGLTIREGGNVDSVGTNIDFTFSKMTWMEAFLKTIELADTGWYWFIDAGGDVFFGEKSATADHTFMIGKDVNRLSSPNSIEDVVNDVTVAYDGGTQQYDDATSIAAYGKREMYIDQSANTDDSTTALQIATKEVEDKKDPIIEAELEINNLYDISSIRPGQTCKVLNYKKDSGVFATNMLIVSTSYENGKTLKVKLEAKRDFGTELQSFVDSESNKQIASRGGGSGAVDSVFGRNGAVVAQTNDYTWAQIDKTTSDIADITSRSHTDLTDIGSNTHAQIDSHIADVNEHIDWTNATQNLDTSGSVECSDIILPDGGAIKGQDGGNTILSFNDSSDGVNYLNIGAGETGGALEVNALGTDTDISIKISPKGAGDILLALASSSHVGIGASSPSEKLQVGGSVSSGISGVDGRYSLRRASDGTEICTFQSIDSSVKINTTVGFSLLNSGSAVLVMDTSGNIGIGTTSPTGLLHLQRSALTGFDSHDDDSLILERSGDWININMASDIGSSISFSDATRAIGYIAYTHSTDAMSFATAGAEVVRIDSSGNVGIGTTSPSSLLHVQTTTTDNTNGIAKIENNNSGVGALTDAQFILKNKYGSCQFMAWQANGLRIGSRTLTSGTGDVIFTAGSDSEKMRILASNGSVGIGTASPATSAKLEIASTTGALLLPRMTTTQRNALTAVNGMILYNSTTNKVEGYENGSWVDI